MAIIDEIPELTDREIAIDTRWWDCGMHPPTRRVWRDGVDVTDEDPSTWPALWQPGVTIRSARGSRSARR